MTELSYDTTYLAKLVTKNVEKLDSAQKKIYNEILNSDQEDCACLFFPDAPGGTGKIYVINLIIGD